MERNRHHPKILETEVEDTQIAADFYLQELKDPKTMPLSKEAYCMTLQYIIESQINSKTPFNLAIELSTSDKLEFEQTVGTSVKGFALSAFDYDKQNQSVVATFVRDDKLFSISLEEMPESFAIKLFG